MVRFIAVILYSMPEWIKQLDTALFFLLNRDLQNRLFDAVMPFITGRAYIIVLPFLILFLLKERKGGLVILALSFFSILLADGSANALKHLIGRVRPCNVLDNVHLLVGCSSSFSMPSNHAANSFAFATPFMFMTRNRLRYLFVFIAALVCLSRVIVGVHYPSDVIVGAVAGSLMSIAVVCLYRWSHRRFRDRPLTTVLFVFLLSLSIFRMYYILYGPLDLSPDEAHYWEWSRRLDLSYYSKGPMIAYLIAASTYLFGDNVFGVRFPAVIFSALSSLVLYRLGKEMYNERVGASSAILLQIIPLYSAFGVIFTIDSPFVFFWILSLYLFWKAVNRNASSTHYGLWLLLGISIGLGLLTKYTMAFFYMCAFLYLTFKPADNHGSRKTFALHFCASVLISILVFIPVILWNAQHDWVTLRHTAGQAHIAEGLKVSVKSLVEFIGSQVGVLTPLLFVLMIAALWRIRDSNRPQSTAGQASRLSIVPWSMVYGLLNGGRFLIWFSAPVIVSFALKSLQGKVQANWAMMGYITGIIALSEAFISSWNNHKTYLKALLIAGIGISVLATSMAHYPPKVLPVKLDPSSRLKGWRELGREVSDIYMGMPKDTFIFSDRYQVSSELAFYVNGHPVTYCVNLGRRMNQYDLWPGLNGLIHNSGIFVTIGDIELPLKVKEAFSECEKRLLRVYDRGRPLREYSIFQCHDFRGMKEERTGNY
ncbi:MAG: glycosyltransferase family 39 protein [Thermodesulfovibrionales bacterium]